MVIDIILVIIILLFIIIGLTKGFCRSIISFVGWILTLVLVIALAKPFANVLVTIIPINSWFEPNISNSLSKLEVLNVSIANTNGDTSAILKSVNLPQFLLEALNTAIANSPPDTEITIAQVLASLIANVLTIMISGLILFILLRIFFKVLERVVGKHIQELSIIENIDRALGGLLGFAKGFLLIFVAFAVLTPLSTLSLMSGYRNDLEKSKLGSWFSEHNFIATLLYKKMNLTFLLDNPLDENNNQTKNNLLINPQFTPHSPLDNIQNCKFTVDTAYFITQDKSLLILSNNGFLDVFSLK